MGVSSVAFLARICRVSAAYRGCVDDSMILTGKNCMFERPILMPRNGDNSGHSVATPGLARTNPALYLDVPDPLTRRVGVTCNR